MCFVAGACAAFAWNARRLGRSALPEYEVAGYSGATILLTDGEQTIEMPAAEVDVDPDEEPPADDRAERQLGLAPGTRVVVGRGFVAAVPSRTVRANAARAQESMTRLAIGLGVGGIALLVAGIFLL